MIDFMIYESNEALKITFIYLSIKQSCVLNLMKL